MEFRQLTLERLQKFVAQRYFITKDYLDGEVAPVTSPYVHFILVHDTLTEYVHLYVAVCSAFCSA